MIIKMKASEYRKTGYSNNSRPAVKTITQRIARGDLPGVIEGKGSRRPRYYVLVNTDTGLPQFPDSQVEPVNRVAAEAFGKLGF